MIIILNAGEILWHIKTSFIAVYFVISFFWYKSETVFMPTGKPHKKPIVMQKRFVVDTFNFSFFRGNVREESIENELK